MKTFAGIKPLATIKQQCKAQGLVFDDERYRKFGSDFIVVQGGGAYVLFNTFNGKFFGQTQKGEHFNSSSPEHESQPWFQALLSFFYVECGSAA